MARSPRPQDISWFLDLHEKSQLNLEPPYQRRSVWSRRDREFFMDTVMNNLPAPPVFLHKTLDENGKSTFHVVDGKQRLQTIIDFRANKVRLPEDFADNSLQKKKWNDLGREQRELFWNYEIVVEQIPDVSDASIKNIFERINRNSRKLTPQELRHAKYDGWFVNAAEAEAETGEWKQFGLMTRARSKRMADVQFVSELMILTLEKTLRGFDQDAIDDLYAQYEDLDEQPMFVLEDFEAEFAAIKAYVLEMLEADPSLTEVFKVQGHFYTLWSVLVIDRARLPDAAALAGPYRQFLNRVGAAIKAGANPPAVEDGDVIAPLAQTYASNLRGASTDLPQRRARHEALVAALIDLTSG
ncbi:DUF262 domain-containing protein [Brevundimonas sp. UBA2416]|uniref:DUF262 domain-containing protein n=1 Tax=Brevundimonas sp. UBA2416 TaxID=1946124 RepID=UPI0025BCC31F|nr:DUF262 domain-containing protein [Brevundimonas sp. UBA2416]